MTAEQVARSADQTATILRGLAAAYGAALVEARIVWYCAMDAGELAALDRVTDLSEGIGGVTSVLANYVAFGTLGLNAVTRAAHELAKKGQGSYGVRAAAYLARVAEHVRAALQGEPAQIPSSDGLGPYPPPSAP